MSWLSSIRRAPAPRPATLQDDLARMLQDVGRHMTVAYDVSAVARQQPGSAAKTSRQLDLALEAIESFAARPQMTDAAARTARNLATAVLDAKRGVGALETSVTAAGTFVTQIATLRAEVKAEAAVLRRWGIPWRELADELDHSWAEAESVTARNSAPNAGADAVSALDAADRSLATQSGFAASRAHERIGDLQAELDDSALTTRAAKRAVRVAGAPLATGTAVMLAATAAAKGYPNAAETVGPVAVGVAGTLGLSKRNKRQVHRDVDVVRRAIAELAVLAGDTEIPMEQRRDLIRVVTSLAPETGAGVRANGRLRGVSLGSWTPRAAAIDDAVDGLDRIRRGRPLPETAAHQAALDADADARRIEDVLGAAEQRARIYGEALAELRVAPPPAARDAARTPEIA